MRPILRPIKKKLAEAEKIAEADPHEAKTKELKRKQLLKILVDPALQYRY